MAAPTLAAAQGEGAAECSLFVGGLCIGTDSVRTVVKERERHANCFWSS